MIADLPKTIYDALVAAGWRCDGELVIPWTNPRRGLSSTYSTEQALFIEWQDSERLAWLNSGRLSQLKSELAVICLMIIAVVGITVARVCS